jgi:putative oxidoreductase
MPNKIFSQEPLNTDVAALFLRLTFGGLFFYHGYQKVIHYDEYLTYFTDIIGIGIKLSYNLLIFAELVCGFFVTIGFLTRITVIPIFIAMSVAVFIAHAKDKFQIKELAFLFLLLSIVVFVLGSGKYSLDNLLFKNKTERSVI